MDYFKAIAELLIEKTCGIEAKETECVVTECDCNPLVYTAVLASTSILLLNLLFISLNNLMVKKTTFVPDTCVKNYSLTPEEFNKDLEAESDSDSSGSDSETEPETDFIDIKL